MKSRFGSDTRGLLEGGRHALLHTRTLEFDELRPYVPGDDVRQLDPSATARTGIPHVRLQVPERALTTWMVIDVSPSMAFGTADRLKIDVADGATLALGRAAIRRAGRVALLSFGCGEPRLSRPRASRPGFVALRRRLAEGVAPDGAGDPRALANALVRVGQVARQPGLVVVISDFRDQEDWTAAMGSVAVRHSVLAIEVRDPRRPRCRRWVTWRSSTPRPASGSRSTPRGAP